MSSDNTVALSPAEEAMRMPPSAASDVPMAQLDWATDGGAGAVEQGQRTVVDHGPHGHAEAGAVEQQPQADRHRDGHARW